MGTSTLASTTSSTTTSTTASIIVSSAISSTSGSELVTNVDGDIESNLNNDGVTNPNESNDIFATSDGTEIQNVSSASTPSKTTSSQSSRSTVRPSVAETNEVRNPDSDDPSSDELNNSSTVLKSSILYVLPSLCLLHIYF